MTQKELDNLYDKISDALIILKIITVRITVVTKHIMGIR